MSNLLRLLLLATIMAAAATGSAAAGAAEPERPTAPQGYTPGLGEIMTAIQLRHAKLWFAGQAGNWQLAAYEVDELREAFEDAVRYQPDFDGKPIAMLVPAVTSEPLTQLARAIDARSPGRFATAFDRLSQACTTCHQATDHGFIMIQRPLQPPLTNQRFDIPSKP